MLSIFVRRALNALGYDVHRVPLQGRTDNSGSENFTAVDIHSAIANLRRLDRVGFLDEIGDFEIELRDLTGRNLRIGKENVRNTGENWRGILSGPLREKVRAVCAADQEIWDAVQHLRSSPGDNAGQPRSSPNK